MKKTLSIFIAIYISLGCLSAQEETLRLQSTGYPFRSGAHGEIYCDLPAAKIYEQAMTAAENSFSGMSRKYMLKDKADNKFVIEISEAIVSAVEYTFNGKLWYDLTVECRDSICLYTFDNVALEIPVRADAESYETYQTIIPLNEFGTKMIPNSLKYTGLLRQKMDSLYSADLSGLNKNEQKKHFKQLSDVMDDIELELLSLGTVTALWEQANQLLEIRVPAFHEELLKQTSLPLQNETGVQNP